MRVRTIAGVIVSILGLVLVMVAGLDFNNLFFAQRLLTKSAIPLYNQSVVLPALLGLLVLLDGSLVLGLKRAFSLIVDLAGNLVCLYAINTLYQKLAVPIDEIYAYQQVFYLLFLGTVLFIIGTIVNDIPKRH